MNSICKHCGTNLEQNLSVCPSCHQKIDLTKVNSTKKPLDEFKINLIAMSSKVVSIAKVVGSDLASEIRKINEARKQAKESAEFTGAENKRVAYRQGIGIFWQKLTGKQKAILVGIPMLILILLMTVLEDKKSTSSVRAAPKTQTWTDEQEMVTRAMYLIFLQRAGVSLQTDMFECNIRGFKKYYAAGDVKKAIEKGESRALEIANKCIANVNSHRN